LLALFWVQGVVCTPDFRAQPALHLQLQAQDERRDETLALAAFLATAKIRNRANRFGRGLTS